VVNINIILMTRSCRAHGDDIKRVYLCYN